MKICGEQVHLEGSKIMLVLVDFQDKVYGVITGLYTKYFT